MTREASIFSLDDEGIGRRWSDLDGASVIGTPFSERGYMEDLAAVRESRLKAVFISDEKGGTGDVAGVLLPAKRKAGILDAAAGGFTPFSALAATRLPSEADVHSRASWMDRLAGILGNRFGRADLRLPPSLVDVRPFQWSGWDAAPLYTFRLDIEDPDRCLAGWSEGARRILNRMGDRFDLRSDSSSEHDIVRLCLASYDRHGRRPPMSSNRLEGLVLRQVRKGRARCFTVHEDGRESPVAGIAVQIRDDVAFYWVAGSVPGPAMTVLIGRLIAVLSGEGVTTFDLVGANTPSIAEFKRRLNPKLVSYYRLHHIRSRFLRILIDAKQALRR